LPETTELSPIEPVLSTFTKLKPIAAPTCALDDSRLNAMPDAFAAASACCVAPTSTAPLPASVSPFALRAVFVISTQLKEIAAATPTLPPEFPDWPEPWLFPLPACICALGSVPVVLPVFGFPATWLFAWLSALPPLDDLPFALACVSLTTAAMEVDAIVIAPAFVMLRSVEPSVSTRTTLTAMIAPTATLLPAASASPVVVTSAT
jgi:hypothetical protein